MKTSALYSVIFALILSAFFSSCSFLQKGEFAQRKYYNFPRTNHSITGKPSDFASAKKEKTVTEKITAKEENSSEPSITASADKKASPPSILKEKIISAEKKESKSFGKNILKDESPVVHTNKMELLKRAIRKLTNPSSDSDAMLILELILAILLPPVAVLLKSGKLSKWFWITLLLCIFAGGLFGLTYGGYGGLLWAIAVVIAICYVFGIIRG